MTNIRTSVLTLALLIFSVATAQTMAELTAPHPIPTTVKNEGTQLTTSQEAGLETCSQLITITSDYRVTAIEFRRATDNTLSFELGVRRTDEHYNLEYSEPENTARLTLNPTTTAYAEIISTRQETSHTASMDAITLPGAELIPLILTATEDMTFTFHAGGRVYTLLLPSEVSQIAAEGFGSICMPTTL